tara:strand:+ start:384 stop:677 length:294 start_codon:yes stop_codon:yes gene_type:complete
MASKSQRDIINAIKELQYSALREMKIASQSLEKEVDRTLKKIESEGVRGYYSVNNDAMTYASRLWKSSLRLGELKRLEESMRKEIKKQSVNRLSKKQ